MVGVVDFIGYIIYCFWYFVDYRNDGRDYLFLYIYFLGCMFYERIWWNIWGLGSKVICLKLFRLLIVEFLVLV